MSTTDLHNAVMKDVSRWFTSDLISNDTGRFRIINNSLYVMTDDDELINRIMRLFNGFDNIYITKAPHILIISKITHNFDELLRTQDYVSITIRPTKTHMRSSNDAILLRVLWAACAVMFIFVIFLHYNYFVNIASKKLTPTL